jgi:DUF2971 family protein
MNDGSNYCFLNPKGLSRDTFVYRIVPKNRFYELFDIQENVLVTPSMWDDPFENFVLKSLVLDSAGAQGKFGFHNDLYGQCWTLHKSSDAMWRIYSPHMDAIRIRTTIDKLANSLSVHLNNWAHVQCLIGQVRYLSEAKLKKFAELVFKNGIALESIGRTLLVKRKAFSHEREVRLMYLEKDTNVSHANGLYRYPIDPHAVIDQVMIDPRLSKLDAKALKKEIESKTGFQGEIKRSLLYAPPNGFVVKIH